MTLIIKKDEEGERVTREFRSNPDLLKIVQKTIDDTKKLSLEIISQVEKTDLTACPCILSDLLKDLNAEQLQGAILILARVAAINIRTGLHSEKPFVTALHHTLARRDEMLALETLSAEELTEQ